MDENQVQPTKADLEQLLERLTKPNYVWRMARARLVGFAAASDDAQVRSAETRRRNALKEVREVLEQLGWRYEGADHDRQRVDDKLLRWPGRSVVGAPTRAARPPSGGACTSPGTSRWGDPEYRHLVTTLLDPPD